MRLWIILLLVPLNCLCSEDLLLEYMLTQWSTPQEKPHLDDPEASSDVDDESEAEVYHWNLGEPDNLEETIIIYEEQDPCKL